jgi:hypothetical protein
VQECTEDHWQSPKAQEEECRVPGGNKNSFEGKKGRDP